jgi:predicted TIM-barrel fold metal-dependent hydrolase
VLYASDWPNAGHDPVAGVAAALFSAETRQRILGANAAALFGVGAAIGAPT